jgi:hypothetical protein
MAPAHPGKTALLNKPNGRHTCGHTPPSEANTHAQDVPEQPAPIPAARREHQFARGALALHQHWYRPVLTLLQLACHPPQFSASGVLYTPCAREGNKKASGGVRVSNRRVSVSNSLGSPFFTCGEPETAWRVYSGPL